ncbi:MAG: hypothetical protein FWB86_00895 [Treponema sp.]|nr:hypothetical protein [Treponema sp.]MCL2250655.1 hypothetical protein [Treponema sp.]
MKRFLIILLIILTICTVISCNQPIGSIDANGNGNGAGSGELEFLWLVPARILYETEQWFVPGDDLQIMYAGDGVVKEIPYNTPGVEIEILEHAHSVDNPNTIPITNGEIKLNTAGRHKIKVSFNDKSSHYTIEVRGTYSGGGDESDIFDIIWL